MSVPFERIADWSASLCTPDSNGAVLGSGDDVLPIGGICNGPHRASVPLERIADWRTRLGIPDSNGAIEGSGGDVLPTRRVNNGQHGVSVPLERIADWSTSLGIICPKTPLDMSTTGDDEIWDYLSKIGVEGHKSNVSFVVYQPIIVIGSEGGKI